MSNDFVEKINFGFKNQRLPVIIQAESSECGLACLGMIANYYNYHIDLATLRGKFSISQKGVNLRQLLDISKQMNLASRSLRLDLDELEQLRLPCILHWDFNHFVVLKSVSGNKCVIHDPAVGSRTIPMSEMSKSFTGVAVELWPDEGFQQKEEVRQVRWSDLIGKIVGLKWSFIQILILALAMEIFGLISPLFTQWTIDHVLISGDRSLLKTILIGFAIMIFVQQVISLVRAWTMMYITTSLSVQWQAGVFRHLTRLPMEYFHKRHLGDIVSRFGSVGAIQSSLSSAFFVAVLDGLVTIVTLVMMLLYSVNLTLICIGFIVVYVLIRVIWYRPLRAASEEQIIHGAKQQSYFLESIRGIRTIKLFRKQNERSDDWLSLLINQINSGVRAQKLQIYYQQVNATLNAIENIVMLGLGASMVMDQTFTVGVWMAFNSYKGQFAGRIGSLVDKFFELKMLSIQKERLADIVLTEPESDEDSGFIVPDKAPEIEFKNIQFQYSEHEPMVLNNVSFKINAGESIALAGQSGCGKTTLTQILAGSLTPVGGDILVNGVNFNDIGVNKFRQFSATVLQDDVLFAGSILDNITFFDHVNDIEWARECAKMAAIDDDIMQMPMQYNTLVGDMGLALSGGQKQRLLLARALYKRPLVLILDEATSHLDVNLEQKVNEAVKKMNMTRIIVAHRPQTLAMVDRIIFLGNGEVQKIATPEEVFPAEHLQTMKNSGSNANESAGNNADKLQAVLKQSVATESKPEEKTVTNAPQQNKNESAKTEATSGLFGAPGGEKSQQTGSQSSLSGAPTPQNAPVKEEKTDTKNNQSSSLFGPPSK